MLTTRSGGAETRGTRAVLVHAKDETAKKFYEKFDFEPAPADEFQLFLRVADIRKNLPD